jgi:hypothetical protein
MANNSVLIITKNVVNFAPPTTLSFAGKQLPENLNATNIITLHMFIL